ncbi:hypothetical protein A3850_010100 [Lewinella sp. 4G2]|nr:hypothetical protein A3850_010100 [Lewinella sp. 4G2]
MNELYGVNLRQSGAIDNNGTVTGYYFLTVRQKERRVKGKKKPQITKNYHLELYDVDMAKIGEKVIRDKPGLAIRQVAYNGTYLAVKMANHVDERKWVELLDGSGETVNRATLKYSAYDDPKLVASFANYGFKELHSIPGGFVNVDVMAEKKLGRSKYEVKFISNEKEVKGWTKRSSSKSKDYEFSTFITTTDSLAIYNVWTRPNLLSQKMEGAIAGVHLRTGKLVFKRQVKGDENTVAWSSGQVVDDQIMITGHDVGSSNKIYTDSPKGLNAVWFDLEGKQINQKRLSMDEVFQFTSASIGGIKGKNLYIHETAIDEKGNFIIACEYYNSFNGGLSALEGLVIGLDETFNLEAVALVEKGRSRNGEGIARTLSGGISLGRKETVAAIAAANGEFDHALLHTEAGATTVAYFGGNKTVRQDGNLSIFVNLVKDGQIKQEKMSFSANTDFVRILPARPGYIAVAEYDKDTKSLNVRVERLNF